MSEPQYVDYPRAVLGREPASPEQLEQMRRGRKRVFLGLVAGLFGLATFLYLTFAGSRFQPIDDGGTYIALYLVNMVTQLLAAFFTGSGLARIAKANPDTNRWRGLFVAACVLIPCMSIFGPTGLLVWLDRYFKRYGVISAAFHEDSNKVADEQSLRSAPPHADRLHGADR